MRRILITGGPSNEYIDEVMKITNMSSGYLGVKLAEEFANGDNEVTLLLTKTVRYKPKNNKIRVVNFETTESLVAAIEAESKSDRKYDLIIHSAAVGDYKPEYSFKLEDMAEELSKKLRAKYSDITSVEEGTITDEILYVLKNPDCKIDDTSKISSNEENLTVKLELTPKVISSMRELFPDAYICGFKLLENVKEDELVNAAKGILEKNNIDLVFANDLAQLRRGNTSRLVVTKSGYNGIKVDDATGIYNLINIVFETKN